MLTKYVYHTILVYNKINSARGAFYWLRKHLLDPLNLTWLVPTKGSKLSNVKAKINFLFWEVLFFVFFCLQK